MSDRTCSIDGCDRSTRSKTSDWCHTHYMRWRRTGDPGAAIPIVASRQNPSNSEVNYFAFHARLRKARGSAADQQCVECGLRAAQWAYLHGKDSRSFDSDVPMCRSCHKKYDATPEVRERHRQAAMRRERSPGGGFAPRRVP